VNPEAKGASEGVTSPERSHDEEIRLIRASRDGDGGAFEELMRPFLSDLRDSVRSGLRSHLDPEETLQDVLVTCWKALPRYVEAYRFRSYVFGIAREVVKRKKYDRPREVPVDWGGEETPARQEPPVKAYEQADERIRSLIGAERFHSPDARISAGAVFRELLEALLGYGGYPHQQIAFVYSMVLWGKARNERRGRQGSVGFQPPRLGGRVSRRVGGSRSPRCRCTRVGVLAARVPVRTAREGPFRT
jgi:DNA-directed RNA polymerase specialized sigma24 family protein